MSEVRANRCLATSAAAQLSLKKAEPLCGQVSEGADVQNALNRIEHGRNKVARVVGKPGQDLELIALPKSRPLRILT